MIKQLIFIAVLLAVNAAPFKDGFIILKSDGLALNEAKEIENAAEKAIQKFQPPQNHLTEIAEFMHDELFLMPGVKDNYCFTGMTSLNAYFATAGKFIYLKSDSSTLHIFCSQVTGGINVALP